MKEQTLTLNQTDKVGINYLIIGKIFKGCCFKSWGGLKNGAKNNQYSMFNGNALVFLLSVEH